MFTTVRRLAVCAAAVVLAGALWTGQAQAQRINIRTVAPGMTVQTYRVPPANYLDPYGINRRNAYLIRLYGRAYSQVPPYALGYNPYLNYYAPTYMTPPVPPLYNPLLGYYNPYGVNFGVFP
jgi:hypothetical protein